MCADDLGDPHLMPDVVAGSGNGITGIEYCPGDIPAVKMLKVKVASPVETSITFGASVRRNSDGDMIINVMVPR